MKLIYRGHAYDYAPAPAQSFQIVRALNWRFHPPGFTPDKVAHLTRTSVMPKALNWRFHTPVLSNL
jgi:hypothetical protein